MKLLSAVAVVAALSSMPATASGSKTKPPQLFETESIRNETESIRNETEPALVPDSSCEMLIGSLMTCVDSNVDIEQCISGADSQNVCLYHRDCFIGTGDCEASIDDYCAECVDEPDPVDDAATEPNDPESFHETVDECEMLDENLASCIDSSADIGQCVTNAMEAEADVQDVCLYRDCFIGTGDCEATVDAYCAECVGEPANHQNGFALDTPRGAVKVGRNLRKNIRGEGDSVE